MATNPMQRKARNSFLLGVLVTLLITGLVIGLLVKVLIDTKKEQEAQELAQVQVYALKQDVKSGQIITEDMLRKQKVPFTAVPNNAVEDLNEFKNYSLEDKKTGNAINTDEDGNLFIIQNDVEVPIIRKGEKYQKILNYEKQQVNVSSSKVQKDEDGNLFVMENGNKILIIKKDKKYYQMSINEFEFIELNEVPLVAKINMQANSVVTLDLLAKTDEIASNDLRLQEYNMLPLPVKVEVDDYIDIRLTLPSGQDYIVISKKRIIDIMENTIWLKLTEEEILTMSNAIVEAYQMTGSKLYVSLYTEPGLQAVATPTYAVSQTVLKLIENNPNIRQTAKKALFDRYTQAQVDIRTNEINGALNQYADEAKSNIETKLQEENEKRQELREKYLEQLSGATTGIVE